MEKKTPKPSKKVKTNCWDDYYVVGVANPAKWTKISKELTLGKTYRQIAADVHCSLSLVNRVHDRNENGEFLPRDTGRALHSTKWSEDVKELLREIVNSSNIQTAKQLKQTMEKDIGHADVEPISLATYRRYLHELHISKKLRKIIFADKSAEYEHPKKFSTLEKIIYYSQYCTWVTNLPSSDFASLKFYDEAQIAKTSNWPSSFIRRPRELSIVDEP
jgi:transposase